MFGNFILIMFNFLLKKKGQLKKQTHTQCFNLKLYSMKEDMSIYEKHLFVYNQ